MRSVRVLSVVAGLSAWLPGCVGITLAADAEPGPSQEATAGPGGVALNIYGDRNVVSVSLADPQVKAIVARLMATSTRIQKRQKGQDDRLSEIGRQMEDVRQAVASIVAASRQPNADKSSLETVSLLSAGQIEPAQKLLKAQEDATLHATDQHGSDDSTPRQRAAELAMDQAALASLSDTQAAIAAYQRASQYEPDNPWTLMKLGDLQMSAGRTSDALATFEQAKAIAGQRRSPKLGPGKFEHEVSAASLRSGDAMAALGDNDGALAQYREGLKASELFDDASPDFTGLLWARAALHQRIGDVFVVKRDFARAFDEYQRSVQIRKRIVAARPSDSRLALGLASTYQKIGDLLTKQADYERAIRAYQEAAAAVPASTETGSASLNNTLARIYQRTGNAELHNGDRVNARRSFLQALTFQKSLVAQDPKNAEWQQELAFTRMRIGDLEMGGGSHEQALTEYREALRISIELAAIDSKNVDSERRVAVCERKVGVALYARGDSDGALASLHRSVKLSEKLVGQEPTNPDWRTDLALTYWRLGMVEHGQPLEDRTKYLEKSVEIFNELNEKGELAQDDRKYAAGASSDLNQLRRRQSSGSARSGV
ncbi:photosystem I assembly protein Ycf3 [Caballeronia pedi]|uniref:Photosystem I assembly protein Ycf3 n=1 Tax=Caballeronia pedi TaxID=1777141 RepID=A0A157ZNY2_9BURK|nr:tetratricopeptide repeat protein [Caballeronia pedi]SAK47224.1 photosystem I assembly protein Ycf3 [Caballeronia pedi]